MVYDDEAGAQYLYGGVDRLRANVRCHKRRTPKLAIERLGTAALAAAKMSLAQAIRQERRKSQRVELSVD